MKYLLAGEESERLYFRKIKESDFDTWLEYHVDTNSSKYWKGDFGTPEEECKKWYERQLYRYEQNLGGLNALINKDSGALVGHCGLLVQTVDDIKELEIGYGLMPQFRNKGYATEAARKCRDFAFKQDYAKHLISIISVTNAPSERVARKNGMTISKTTLYSENEVNIFGITKEHWKTIVME